ncbi:MAG: hypothetical protein U0935_23575 [Pirellulales bacterium]
MYVGPPFNHRKDRFKSVSVPVIRQTGEALAQDGLSSFVQSLRQAREARQ